MWNYSPDLCSHRLHIGIEAASGTYLWRSIHGICGPLTSQLGHSFCHEKRFSIFTMSACIRNIFGKNISLNKLLLWIMHIRWIKKKISIVKFTVLMTFTWASFQWKPTSSHFIRRSSIFTRHCMLERTVTVMYLLPMAMTIQMKWSRCGRKLEVLDMRRQSIYMYQHFVQSSNSDLTIHYIIYYATKKNLNSHQNIWDL